MTAIISRHRVVLTYGRFDCFDRTHAHLLRKLSVMGDELIVGCATDVLVDFEHTLCSQKFKTRRAMLESCRYVSRVISHERNDQHQSDIVNYNVSLLVVSDTLSGQFDSLRDITNVLYMSGFENTAYHLDKRQIAAA